MLNTIFWKKLLIFSLLTAIFSINVFAAINNPTQELYIIEAYNTGDNEFEIVFSNEIDEKSLEPDESLFRIESINTPSDFYDVIEKNIDSFDKKVMILTLDKNFTIGENYKVIVLKVQDIYGQNIINGVDSEAEFEAIYFPPEITETNDSYLTTETNTTTNYDNNIGNNINNNIETNIEDSENNINDDANIEGDLGGVSLNAGDVENQVLVVAEDNSKLPTTGPEHILIFVLALIIGGGLFIYKYRKI